MTLGNFPALRQRAALVSAAMALCLGLTPGAQAEPSAYPGECGEIVLAEFAWATAGLSARVLDMALSDGYGCEVKRQAATPRRATAAVAQSDQRMRAAEARAAPLGGAPVDPPAAVIAVEAQTPAQGHESGGASEGVALGAELYGGLDRGGWFAPSWLTAAHPELRRIEDVASRPELFADNPNAKPKLHICPTSWPCHADDRALIAQLGLEKHFEIVTPASGDALTASLINAWRYRRPWLGSYWTPSATVAEYSMTRFEIGALEICEKPQGAGEAERRCRQPHRNAPRVTLYPESLERRSPEVAAALRRFALPPEVVLDALAWRAANNADLDDAALQLLDANPRLWQSWLDAPARRRFQEALAIRLKRADQRVARAVEAKEASAARPAIGKGG